MSESWFKNENEKEELQSVINDATVARTEEINDYILEKNRPITEMIQHIVFIVGEIEDKLYAHVNTSFDKNEISFYQLKSEFEKMIKNFLTQLHEFSETHPGFQKEIQEYKRISGQLQIIVNAIEENGSVSETFVSEWEKRKSALLDEFENIKKGLIRNESGEPMLPSVGN